MTRKQLAWAHLPQVELTILAPTGHHGAIRGEARIPNLTAVLQKDLRAFNWQTGQTWGNIAEKGYARPCAVVHRSTYLELRGDSLLNQSL